MVRYLYAHGAPYLNAGDVFAGLMRRELALLPDEVISWFEGINARREADFSGARHFPEWPCGYMIQQVERHAAHRPLSDSDLTRLRAILEWPPFQSRNYWGSDLGRVRVRIERLLASDARQLAGEPRYDNLGGDAFGQGLEQQWSSLKEAEAGRWNAVFHLAATALGARPTQKFQKSRDALQDRFGKEVLRNLLHHFLEAAVVAALTKVDRWPPKIYFSDANTTLVKGLVWMSIGFQDRKTVHLIADLCEKCMKKIPACGIASQAVANACFLYLEATPGADVAARLSRLALMIRQKTVKARIEAAIARKADAAGLTPAALEERVVPTFGLTDGARSVAFKDHSLQIVLEGPGAVSQMWCRADGTVQKSTPKSLGTDAKLKARFAQIKREIGDLKKTATGQRNRIDRLFAEDVTWSWDDFETYYIAHPLVSVLARRMIWDLSQKDGSYRPALFQNGAWSAADGGRVYPDKAGRVRLWHPVESDVETVRAWRQRLVDLAIVQPTKQAFREVYLLTDAERATATYSNRMAGHLVKQHQMANLMGARGWTYQLMGGFDDGKHAQFAQKTFATSPLRASYLIHRHWDNANINDMGMMIFVGTDQLRFCTADDTAVPLEEIPRRQFSETMRDADLFVGVASIGNDPLWRDQGPVLTPAVRDYWEGYAFGALDAFAETRKDLLAYLLPRLKIAEQAHIEGRYLIVDGKRHSYRIHLGSGNVLIAPDDRFLCIVPSGLGPTPSPDLPFEGDMRLSLILSKALLLAEDDKITDPVILAQI